MAEFAVTTHIGHYRTLGQAYGTIVDRVGRLKGCSFGGLPSSLIKTTSLTSGSSADAIPSDGCLFVEFQPHQPRRLFI